MRAAWLPFHREVGHKHSKIYQLFILSINSDMQSLIKCLKIIKEQKISSQIMSLVFKLGIHINTVNP